MSLFAVLLKFFSLIFSLSLLNLLWLCSIRDFSLLALLVCAVNGETLLENQVSLVCYHFSCFFFLNSASCLWSVSEVKISWKKKWIIITSVSVWYLGGKKAMWKNLVVSLAGSLALVLATSSDSGFLQLFGRWLLTVLSAIHPKVERRGQQKSGKRWSPSCLCPSSVCIISETVSVIHSGGRLE